MQVKYKKYEKLALFYHYLALGLFRKQYKISPLLQWKTNRNSYAIYLMVPLPFAMSLSDPLT